MTAQGIVLNLSQISFRILAQQASSDPVMKCQMGENGVEMWDSTFSSGVRCQKIQKERT